MFDEPIAMNETDWQKEQKRKNEAIKKRLGSVVKKSGSELAKRVLKQKENKGDDKVDQNCEMISTLCYEAQDQLRSGKMSLKEVVTDLCEALEALADMKEVKEEEDGE